MSLPITAIAAAALNPADLALASGLTTPANAGATGVGGFSQMLSGGIDQVNDKLVQAEQIVKSYAIDDSIPLHQVTYALEQGRLALELMMQVRGRLVDSYQNIMSMQL